ncbi:hypothetical protein [Pyrobaculum neutrophilum]|uniref:HTH cro/C1-type domain-containing protein n=1 Tax=Pyrobaculum neutrophilum (strain DSM 2338 / JCM 9278 / NBRC 100436 / V24Sta) TaxID=444157 RepID=B1YBL5_PYRNV|nr:hypothetical protein [Pyrobaculum neutrophilum]ACB40817.1 conserved hypothetical protein [Pyrobaculum neutrophilum V24Sta]
MRLQAIVLIFHGSRDPTHNAQAAEIAKALGVSYAFLEAAEPRYRGGGLGVPMFIADGSDYRKALEVAAVKAPPLLGWPGFVEYLRGLGADLYIFHGPDAEGQIRGTGLPVALLHGEPNVESAPCVAAAAPVVLTRGVIYNEIARRYGRCRTRLLPPLAEQPGFIEYLRRALPAVLDLYAVHP